MKFKYFILLFLILCVSALTYFFIVDHNSLIFSDDNINKLIYSFIFSVTLAVIVLRPRKNN